MLFHRSSQQVPVINVQRRHTGVHQSIKPHVEHGSVERGNSPVCLSGAIGLQPSNAPQAMMSLWRGTEHPGAGLERFNRSRALRLAVPLSMWISTALPGHVFPGVSHKWALLKRSADSGDSHPRYRVYRYQELSTSNNSASPHMYGSIVNRLGINIDSRH